MPVKRKFRLLKSKEMSEQLEILRVILQLNTTVLADRKKTQEESRACSYTPPHGLPNRREDRRERSRISHEKKQPRVKSQHYP